MSVSGRTLPGTSSSFIAMASSREHPAKPQGKNTNKVAMVA
jgi:hypothetical protein